MNLTANFERVCVFCGSRSGSQPEYVEQAMQLGELLASQQTTLVFGGGSVGLMGVIADSVLANGGQVEGVIPNFLATKELLHTSVTTMHQVESMHDRKAKMAELSDAFIALPGGFGTFEELFEIITWAQLGLHQKPIGILNVNGYFDHLLNFLEQSILEGFIKTEHRSLIVVEPTPPALLKRMHAHHPPEVSQWLTPDET